MALSGGAWAADECPSPITVTKTETTTIWADGSWPTKTVTQLVIPDDCPPEPRYTCYVVQTTTLNAQVPQATIQMVLPQQEKSEQQWNTESKGDEEEEDQANDGSDEEVGGDAAESVSNLSVTSLLTSPTATTTASGPACVNYITSLSMGPCPTYTRLPTNGDGCAIVTSTTLTMTTITAVPHVDVTYTYSYSIGHGHGHPDHKHRKYHGKPTLTLTPTFTAAPLPTPPPAAVTLFPPGEQKEVGTPATKTEFTTSFSTHYSYTLSFDFTYGTLKPSPIAGASLPELPAPTSMPTPTPTEPTMTTTTASIDALPAPTDPATPSTLFPTDPADPTTISPASFDPLFLATNKVLRLEDDDPSTVNSLPIPTTPDEAGQIVTIEQPGPEPITKETFPSPSPPPPTTTTTTGLKKACQECAEPCVVELNVAAKAEMPLLAKLFEDKIKKALASLKLTLENESGSTFVQDPDNNNSNNNNNSNDGSASGVPTGLFAGLNVDINTAGSFRKTCEEKLDAIEKKHIEALNEKCERVIQTGCETGACLQSEVEKTVKLLDVMISTELARDCSQLRSEIIQEFKARCDQDHQKAKVNAKVDVDKRGLLSGLLGEDNAVGTVVDGLDDTVNKVVSKTVTSLTGNELVERLIEGLTGTVKSVVDSFVGNCNRKGLLDFDTEKGVGTLAAISDVSLNLFKIVCLRVHVEADANVDTSAH
ncbi:hypothetical protein BGZ96_002267 [Linnemannia gamsii]|uniref:Uncharacterized protein n=1 Tax=Linnemannia gamsii TaxID=64522 RepID=A0ABQ7K8V8_9FUNG|nr:hypothetical protein BGZ96_002267 [Linnemannia gamsii]